MTTYAERLKRIKERLEENLGLEESIIGVFVEEGDIVEEIEEREESEKVGEEKDNDRDMQG